jgi:hypothetical protein
MRQALRAVTSVAPAPESTTPSTTSGADAPAKKEGEGTDARPVVKEGGAPEVRPVVKPQDGFAEIDEEIARLEQTQKVLNTILDMFSRKGKEAAKDRPEARPVRPSN